MHGENMESTQGLGGHEEHSLSTAPAALGTRRMGHRRSMTCGVGCYLLLGRFEDILVQTVAQL